MVAVVVVVFVFLLVVVVHFVVVYLRCVLRAWKIINILNAAVAENVKCENLKNILYIHEM